MLSQYSQNSYESTINIQLRISIFLSFCLSSLYVFLFSSLPCPYTASSRSLSQVSIHPAAGLSPRSPYTQQQQVSLPCPHTPSSSSPTSRCSGLSALPARVAPGPGWSPSAPAAAADGPPSWRSGRHMTC